MHSNGLLRKNINWATESGYWLMWICSIRPSLSFTLFHSFDLSRWSDVTLLVSVALLNPILSRIPSVLFTSISRLGSNGIFKS